MNRILPFIVSLIVTSSLSFLAGVKLYNHTETSSSDGSLLPVLLLLVVIGILILYFYLSDTQQQNAKLKKYISDKALKTQHDAPPNEIINSLKRELIEAKAEIERLEKASKLTQNSTRNSVPNTDNSLTQAVEILTHDLRGKEKEIQQLHEIISRQEQRRILARLATIRETTQFTLKINENGRLDDKDALKQIIQEIEAAFDDLGLEILHVLPGERIIHLQNGSFTILNALPAESPEKAGTVKESLSDAIFIKDHNGKPLFISPAKLRVFKL